MSEPEPTTEHAGIEISKRLILINSISSILRKVIVVGVLVWVQQLYARKLDPAEYELLPVTAAFLVFFPLIPTMFAAGLRRYVTDAYARGDEDEVTSIITTMTPILAAVAAVVLVLGGACAWFIGSILDIAPEYLDQARIMFALMIFGLALRVVVSPYGFGFDLKQRFVLRNAIGLGFELLKTALLVALLSISLKVMWLVVANISATVLELAVATAVSRRLVPALRMKAGAFRRELIEPMLNFGGWSVVIQVSLLVRDAADSLILNKMSTEVETNSFHLGGLLDRHIRHTYFETTANAQPVMTALNATGQDERLRNTFFRLSRYSLWALALPAAPLIVFRDELVALYLEERAALYASAGIVMALLMSRVAVIFPNTLLGMIAAAKAQVKPVALRAAGMSGANLALTFYLVGVRGMGAVGSALATMLVTVIGAPLFNWTLALRLTDARMSDWLRATFLPGLVPALAAAPVWYALWWFVAPDTWLALFACFAGGAAVYGLALLSVLRPEDRADLGRLLARLRPRR